MVRHRPSLLVEVTWIYEPVNWRYGHTVGYPYGGVVARYRWCPLKVPPACVLAPAAFGVKTYPMLATKWTKLSEATICISQTTAASRTPRTRRSADTVSISVIHVVAVMSRPSFLPTGTYALDQSSGGSDPGVETTLVRRSRACLSNQQMPPQCRPTKPPPCWLRVRFHDVANG